MIWDIIGTAVRNGIASVHVLFIRQGKVLGGRTIFPTLPIDSDISELLYAFVQQFYLSDISGKSLPKKSCLIMNWKMKIFIRNAEPNRWCKSKDHQQNQK